MAIKTMTVLGSGELHISQFRPNTFDPAGFRYVGNTPVLSTSVAVEKKDHFDVDHGIAVKDDSIEIRRDWTGSFETDHISGPNLGLFFGGDVVTRSQLAAADVEETILNVSPGLSYQVGVTPENLNGDRNIETLVVTGPAGTPVYEEHVDYEANLEQGTVEIIAGGAITAASSIQVTYDRKVASTVRITPGAQTIEVAMKFVSFNGKRDGVNYDWYWPRVSVSPAGDFAIKGDDWQRLSFTFEALKVPGRPLMLVDGRQPSFA